MSSNQSSGTSKARLSPLKQAYLALEKMHQKLSSLENSRNEPIAILGMGCRYPGGVDSPESYWKLLADGCDAVTEVPPSRWDVDAFYDPDPNTPGKISSRHGAFVENVDLFDAPFFGISPREAESLDPQQRLLLEVGHEAFEDAGIAVDRVVNSLTGVYIGIANGDYYCMIAGSRDKIDAYLGTGTSPNSAAGRMSYVFGLRGPCLAIETACSSSLVAVHLACQNLRGGECDLALAGGVNVMLMPELSITFSKAQMLSPDGRCKSFDAAADGYVRGEGAGVIVLKRLSDAIAAGDRIRAVIRGSAVNQDGPSSGLTVPNGPSQQDVIRRALGLGNVKPDEIGYLEAHGTGTALGDPIEMQAVGEVFQGRADPLWVGSVKTNIGHLEGAAGVAGLMKAVLMLENGVIPPNLHFRNPSPRIPWEELPVRIPTQPVPWARGRRKRLAGVSSFGFSGINAHLVLEESPQAEDTEKPERPIQILPISAKQPEALRELARLFASRLDSPAGLRLSDVCFTAGGGRSHHAHRLAVVAETIAEACQSLEAFAGGESSALMYSEPPQQNRPKPAFLFPGMGCQYTGMEGQLYDTEATFRAAFDECDKILRSYLDCPLEDVFRDGEADAVSLNETVYGLPSLFAIEYALARLWESWTVRPAVMIGQGMGQCVAACLAGVFSLSDALKLVAARAGLAEPGESDQVGKAARTIEFSRPKRKMICNLTGDLAGEEIAHAEYWCKHFDRPVDFSGVLKSLSAQRVDTFLEIGPHTALLESAETACNSEAFGDAPRFLRGLEPNQSDWRSILSALAELYVAGQDVDWQAFAGNFSGRKLPLPTYPFQRRRYWVDVEPTAAEIHPVDSRPSIHPLLGRRLLSAVASELLQFEEVISPHRPSYLTDHRVSGRAVLPATAFVETALAAAREVQESLGGTVIKDLSLHQALPLPDGDSRVTQVVLRPDEDGYRFEFYSRPPGRDNRPPNWTLHASGRIGPAQQTERQEIDLEAILQSCREEVSLEEFYEQLKERGFEYGPSFRGLKRLRRGDKEVLGQVELPERYRGQLNSHLAFPPLLDACLHATLGLVEPEPDTQTGPPRSFVPVGFERIQVFGPMAGTLWSHARLREEQESGPGRYAMDVDLIDPDGRLVASLEGLEARQVDLSMLAPELPLPGTDDAGSTVQQIDRQLEGLPESEKRLRLVGFLEEQVAAILKLPGQDRPPAGENLFELGMDSLMAVELLYRINRGIKVNLPMQELLENAAILPLAQRLVRELDPANTEQPTGGIFDGPFRSSGTTASSPWLPYLRDETLASVRLFCFHPSDGDASDYADWQQHAAPQIEVCAVELPGSGKRPEETPIDDRSTLIEALGEAMLDYFDRPFAFFGHGDGSLTAFELAQFIQDRFGLSPVHLFVAASCPPEGASGSPLECPITAFAPGDEQLGREDLHRWYEFTQSGFRLEMTRGTFASQLGSPENLLRVVIQDLG